MPIASVREAADRFGLSEQRIRALARAGRIPAIRVGGRWVIQIRPGEPRDRRAGRPLASANAWVLLALLSGEDPDWVSPSVRSRLRRRLSQGAWVEEALAHAEPRAGIVRWRVLPADLEKLRTDPRVVRTGLCAKGSELDVVPDDRAVDGYVSAASLRAIERRFRPERSPAEPNLVLRVPSQDWILRHAVAPPAVAAADLLWHEDPRVARAAREVLRGSAR